MQVEVCENLALVRIKMMMIKKSCLSMMIIQGNELYGAILSGPWELMYRAKSNVMGTLYCRGINDSATRRVAEHIHV